MIQIMISLFSVLVTRPKEVFKVWKKKWILLTLLRMKKWAVRMNNKCNLTIKLNISQVQIKTLTVHRILKEIPNQNLLLLRLKENQILNPSKTICLKIRKFMSSDSSNIYFKKLLSNIFNSLTFSLFSKK
jgi:hypothetical protein